MSRPELACELLRVRLARAGGFTLEIERLAVEQGSIVGLLGPNGSGKSTLLSLIDGTLSPDAGELRLAGRPLGSGSRLDRARRVAHVGPSFEPAFDFTVLEVVMMGRYPHRPAGIAGAFGLESAADERSCREALARCRLTGFEQRSIRRLSAGERQRVFIARALAQSAPLLLLDEPTSHLDLAHQVDLQRIARAHADDGGTVIVALHDLSLAAATCDRVVLLDAGRIDAEGKVRPTLTAERLGRLYGTEVRVDAVGEALWIRASSD